MITINIVKEIFSEKYPNSIAEPMPLTENKISFCRISYTYIGIDIFDSDIPQYIYFNNYLTYDMASLESVFSAGFMNCWINYNCDSKITCINLRNPGEVPPNLESKIKIGERATKNLLKLKEYMEN